MVGRRGQSLIGNQRALDIVRGESFPGIDFAEEDDEDAGGKFRVVEPRQVFPGGRLHFLLSIIPNAAIRVTTSVVIDADSQRVTGKFPATAIELVGLDLTRHDEGQHRTREP